MRNNKGINLIALIVMIVIMIILASVAVNISMHSYNEAIKTKQATERQEVIKAVSSRFGEHSRNATANPLLGVMIPQENRGTEKKVYDYVIEKLVNEYGKLITENEEDTSFTKVSEIKIFIVDNLNNMEYTRILNYDDLLNLGIENTTLQAVYLVNYYSSDVVGPIN